MLDSGGSKAKTGYKVVSASVSDSMPSSIGRFTVCRSDWLFSAPAEVESPNEFPGAHAYWTRLTLSGAIPIASAEPSAELPLEVNRPNCSGSFPFLT